MKRLFTTTCAVIMCATSASAADLVFSDIKRMHANYENNQARFFRDFSGKTFSAKLPFEGMSENIFFKGTYNVFFGNNGFLGDIECSVSSNDVGGVIELNKGDIVEVNGTIKDHTMGVIELESCSINEPLPASGMRSERPQPLAAPPAQAATPAYTLTDQQIADPIVYRTPFLRDWISFECLSQHRRCGHC